MDAANSGGRWQTGPLRLCPPELHLLRACAQRVAAVYRLPAPPVPAPGLTFFYVDRVVYSGSVSTQFRSLFGAHVKSDDERHDLLVVH